MIHKLARQNWKLFFTSSITEFHKLARINESKSFFEKISGTFDILIIERTRGSKFTTIS